MIEKFNLQINKEMSNIEQSREESKEELPEKELTIDLRDTYRQIKEIGKTLNEIIPEDRNFDLEIQDNDKEIEILLKDQDGKIKNLSSYLPPGYKFKPGEAFIDKKRKKEIVFRKEELEFRGFLLSLFHEIGHAHKKNEHSITKLEHLKVLGQTSIKFLKSLSFKKEELEEKGIKRERYRLTALPSDALLPLWYIDKRAQAEAKSERDAWAFSLRSLRQFKKDGYNVFAGFDDTTQIQAYITYYLFTRDVDYRIKKIKATGDITSLQENRPLFGKRRAGFYKDKSSYSLRNIEK